MATYAELEVLAQTVKKLTVRPERLYRLMCRLNVVLHAAGREAYYDHGDGYCTTFSSHPDGGSFLVGACKTSEREPGGAPDALARRMYRAYEAWREAAIAKNQADEAFKKASDEFAKAMVA
jgi:hypothetical protein